MISIIDYGMGNLASVQKALELALSNKKINQKILITSDRQIIEQADAIVLPGVGAFGIAMKHLKELGLVDVIKDVALVQKKPFLGICLGYQLLFDKSYEEGEYDGLGIIHGEVKKFDESMGLKIPHMGWNTVDFGGGTSNLYFYFVHSYYADVRETNANQKIFWTEYGIKFAAGIQKDNIFGVQFHPEKSQTNGIKLLENWCREI